MILAKNDLKHKTDLLSYCAFDFVPHRNRSALGQSLGVCCGQKTPHKTAVLPHKTAVLCFVLNEVLFIVVDQNFLKKKTIEF